MGTQDEQQGEGIDAWVAEQLAASPEWTPERYARIRQLLEGGTTAAGE
ncbi:hypothetical protein ACFZDG_19460 [Kitasatospora xanthocidica]